MLFRRHFQHTPAPREAVPPSGLAPYQGPWETPQVTHLLRRLMFGAQPADVDYFLSRSPAEAVAILLRPTANPPPVPVNDYNDGQVRDPDVPFGATWLNAPWNNAVEGARIWSLKAWWIGNMLDQDRSILEKMILFWHNHIPVQFYPVFHARRNYNYLMTLRRYALGNFRKMIRAVTLDPAMLEYLNGQYNSAGAPDENYARELQELFCIGKGPMAQFTEEDVQAAARVLTGWRYHQVTGQPHFDLWQHDTEDKQFSSFYGNRLIRGRSGAYGAKELDELLDMLLEQDECARFLCRKLYRFFVHHEIDEATEANVIEPLAAILRAEQYEILPVLTALFNSEHFFDLRNRGALLKSPLDHNIGLYRELGIAVPERFLLRDRYQHNGTLVYLSLIQQQDLGDPPNVSGWPAYYQAPVYDRSWITTDTLPRRAQMVDWLLWSGISTDNFLSQIDVLAIVEELPQAEDPNALVDQLSARLFGIEIGEALRERLKSILLSGQISDYYWTDAWLSYVANPTHPMKRETVRSRLLAFFYTFLHQEEYQLS